MAERFSVAAFRHLDTGSVLEASNRYDDAGYHFGLAGETALKNALVNANVPLGPLKLHLGNSGNSLQHAIKKSTPVMAAISSGRLSGPLKAEINSGGILNRFTSYSLTIRYADTNFPVTAALCAAWKNDAIFFINGGAF